MKWALRWAAVFAAMAAFRWAPGLAAMWQGRVALPVLAGLHRWSAGFAFPVLEPLALGALGLGLGRRGWRRLMGAALVAAGMLALLWYPGYWARVPDQLPSPEASRLEGLCDALIDSLAPSPLRFAPAEETLSALSAKEARYPEWMRRAGIAGLFSPWTGEIIVDSGGSPALLPFTCIHELMHLRGIADEGEANIAAYRACLQRGGALADSARLWALRYALSQLRATDAEAVGRVTARMDNALRALVPPLEPAIPQPLFNLFGIGPATTSYPALVSYLCLEA